LAAGVFSLGIAMLGFSTGHIYEFPRRGRTDVVSWQQHPGLFFFFLLVWALLGVFFVSLSVWDFLEGNGHTPNSARGTGIILRARSKWEALSVPIQVVIVVVVVLSPLIYLAILDLFG
jgi:hypothetical protein